MSDAALYLANEKETHKLASKIASHCKIGDVILLKGQLGVGKSSFARGFINSFYHSPVEVPSPTFTLLQTYNTPKGEIYHGDFYRLEKQIDALEVGIEDAFHSAITLIEWPDIIDSLLPENRLYINLDYGKSEGTRDVIIQVHGHFKDIDWND